MSRLRLGRSRLHFRGRRYNRKLAASTRAAGQKSGDPRPPLSAGPRITRRSGFLVGGDIAIDEVGDVVVLLLFFFKEGIIRGVLLGVLLDIDVVDHRLGGGLLLARLDLVERHDLHAGGRRNLGLLFFFSLGGWPRPRRGRDLEYGPAFRADNGILVEIKEFGAAVLALMFGSEFGLGQGDLFPVVEDGISAEVRLVAAPRPVNAPYGSLVDSFQRR